jgi:hypothetical protein
MDKHITWTITEAALWHYRKADELAKAILATGIVEPEDEMRVRNFAHFLICTSKISYSDGARDSVKNLVDFLTRWQTLSPAELWDYYLKEIPPYLAVEWQSAFNRSQSLFAPDPAELPLSALSDEDRKRAETPGDPLS